MMEAERLSFSDFSASHCDMNLIYKKNNKQNKQQQKMSTNGDTKLVQKGTHISNYKWRQNEYKWGQIIYDHRFNHSRP